MDNDKLKTIEEQVSFYVNTPNATVKSSAEYFGISRKTFQVNAKKLELFNPRLYSLYLNKTLIGAKKESFTAVSEDMLYEELGFYLMDGNTVPKTCQFFGISEKTFQNHMRKIKDIDQESYELYKEKSTHNASISFPHKPTHRSSAFSLEDIKNIVDIMFEEDLTIRSASVFFKVPKSTLFEVIKSPLLSETRRRRILDMMDDHKSSRLFGNSNLLGNGPKK